MIGQLIKGMALSDGLKLYTSNPDDDLDYEGYIRLFEDKDVQEITISSEESYIYAKKYDGIIIILNLIKSSPQNKVGSMSFLLLRARVISRELNTLFIKNSPEIGAIFRYKTDLKGVARRKTKKTEGGSPLPPSEKAAPQLEKAEGASAKTEPGVEKLVSRFKKKEPLVVKVQSTSEKTVPPPVVEKKDPRLQKAAEEAQAQTQKPAFESKPDLFNSLVLGIYQSVAKKEIKKPEAETPSTPVSEKAEPRSEVWKPGTEKVQPAVEQMKPEAGNRAEAVENAAPAVEKAQQLEIEPAVPLVESAAEASVREKAEPAVEQKTPEAGKGEALTLKAEDEEELRALAKEIIRFKRAFAEKKKKTDV